MAEWIPKFWVVRRISLYSHTPLFGEEVGTAPGRRLGELKFHEPLQRGVDVSVPENAARYLEAVDGEERSSVKRQGQ
ncbi:MAG: hypothetical protein ACO2PM_10065 [Pyrobaculum sp.]|jgi:hypothetical protein